MSEQNVEQSIDQHYGHGDVLATILAGLQAAGKNLDALTLDDLAPVDQIHTRGKQATLELAQHAGLKPAMQVLDVGGGIGGTARIIASDFGCSVTVLDLTAEFCRAGEALTVRTGLSDRVKFHNASALDMPFPDASFDQVWSQHSSMNIDDKEHLFAEIYRVLRPGGRYAFHEIMAGAVSPLHFPVPWAPVPEINFLRSPEAERALLKETGFQEVEWIDKSADTVAWLQQFATSAAAPPSPVGLQLIYGAATPLMGQNLSRNLQENRVSIIIAIFDRPTA